MQLFLLLACTVDPNGDPRTPDSGVRYDVDGDGFFQDEDCDDNDAAIHPGVPEICDGKDNDCNGRYDDGAKDATTVYPDADGDGYAGDDATGMAVCEAKKGFVTAQGDCDDSNPDVHPKAVEQCGDGIDNDCEGGDAAC